MIGKQLSGMRVDIFYDYRNVKPEDMRRWHRDQKETEVTRRWHRD